MALQLLTICGMTCEHCVATVSDRLKATPGVRDAQVDLKTRTARVNHDERLSSVTDLMAAVRRAGYEVDGFQTV